VQVLAIQRKTCSVKMMMMMVVVMMMVMMMIIDSTFG
jgi:hypothetical protein